MKKTVLREYARLIARTGANVQKGQDVFLYAGLDQPAFVTMVAEECYRAGARKVKVIWSSEAISALDARYQKAADLGKLESFELERWRYISEKLPCRIILDSDDPDAYSPRIASRLAAAAQKRYPSIRAYRDAIENKHQWCIAAVPGEAWAHKLFPGLRRSQAVEKLWEAILTSCRLREGTSPEEAWAEHNRSLKEHCRKLNGLGIRELHYRNALGTDLRVGMIPQAQFCGGAEDTLQGVTFQPNMPTEECFISPKKGAAEGTVVATKPLCYQGQLIENFCIRFEGGKAVEWHAEKGEALLGQLIGMDEGSAYLGECALVPFESPINESGLLFYNTLFDENAVCHLALGTGFPDTIRGFETMSLEEVRALGVNESMIHEDFMIGSRDLEIDAICEDGRIVPVFREGSWAL